MSAANFSKLVAAWGLTQKRVKTVVFWGAVESAQQEVSDLSSCLAQPAVRQ